MYEHSPQPKRDPAHARAGQTASQAADAVVASVPEAHRDLASDIVGAISGKGSDSYRALRILESIIGNKEYKTGAWSQPERLAEVANWAQPVLALVLDRPGSYEPRLQAAYLLGKLGTHAQPSVELLVRCITDRKEDERVRDQSISSLVLIDPPHAADTLTQVVKSWRNQPKSSAGRAMFELANDRMPIATYQVHARDLAKQAREFLSENRGNKLDWEKDQAVDLLVKVGSSVPAERAATRAALRAIAESPEENRFNRIHAMNCISKIEGWQAIPLLARHSRDQEVGHSASEKLYGAIEQQPWIVRIPLSLYYHSAYQQGRKIAHAER